MRSLLSPDTARARRVEALVQKQRVWKPKTYTSLANDVDFVLGDLLQRIIFFLVQTKVSWRTLLITWYSRQRLGIKVQSCPVLR